MPSQHITGGGSAQGEPKQEGIVVPLEVGDLRILKQEMQSDGSIEVEVIATTDRARCPHCQGVSVKVHDTRPRRKRDIPLREHRIVLVLLKRRLRCLKCRRSFTEPDQACGKRHRTTKRLREHIGKQARSRPVSHVAAEMKVGPRLVQSCLEEVAQVELANQKPHPLAGTPQCAMRRSEWECGACVERWF